MTPEEQKAAEEEIIRFQEENPNYWGDQDENGVDLARLRENLLLTPAERIQQLSLASVFIKRIDEASERYRATFAGDTSLSRSWD